MSELHDKARHKITFLLNSTSGLFGVDRTEVVDTLVELLAENERLSNGSICELAASNAGVLEYCRHWEARAEAAEARLRELASAEPRLPEMRVEDAPYSDAGLARAYAYGWNESLRARRRPEMP